MANRQQRRHLSKVFGLTQAQQDVVNAAIKENYYRGIEAGKGQAIKTCYAATCKAVRDVYGCETEQVRDFLRVMDKHVVGTLASEEAIDEVFEQIGLRITFSDPFSNIEEVEDAETEGGSDNGKA